MVVKDYIDEFDPNYYMNKYPDVKNAYGTNSCDLLTHFQNYGINEGRFLDYDVEKQSELSNPTFSQNYLKFNEYKINSDNDGLIETKIMGSDSECRNYCNQIDTCSGYTRKSSNDKCWFYNSELYPNGTLDKNSNKTTYVREKVQNIVCDADCQREKKLKKLETKYKTSLYNLESAPENLKNAKRNYIIFKNGEPYYQELYKKELTKKINEIVKKMKIQNEIENKQLTQSLLEYSQKYNLYNSHLKNYLGNIEENNVIYEKQLYDDVNEKQLDARKSYYETNETENIKKYTSFYTVIYYLLFTIYLVLFLINGEFVKPVKIIYLVIFLIFPYIWFYFILKYVSYILNMIYSNLPKDIYFNL